MKKVVYTIYCETGCSCCRDENHWRGLYATEDIAKKRKAQFLSGDQYPVASQYARYGHYSIHFAEIEEISDNRIIYDGRTVLNENEYYIFNSFEEIQTHDDKLDID